MSERISGKVLVLGANGMVGSAIFRVLSRSLGPHRVIAASRDDVDLTDQVATFDYLAIMKPQWVIVAAATVGGIMANQSYPRDFIYNNLTIETNCVEGSFRAGVEQLMFLGSSCIYPKFAVQPISEEALLTGSLEPTNEPYAIAKIAGIKLCESYNVQFGTDYRALMPCNLYGVGDTYHDTNSHVIPALLSRFYRAKQLGLQQIEVWGSGNALREFLYVDDLAEACLSIMQQPKNEFMRIVSKHDSRAIHINVGTGVECSIKDLVNLVSEVVGFKGDVNYDCSKPEGTPRKVLDVSKIAELGWRAKIPLKTGLDNSLKDYIERGLFS